MLSITSTYTRVKHNSDKYYTGESGLLPKWDRESSPIPNIYRPVGLTAAYVNGN